MLQEFLEKLNIKPQKIAIGVSGGADSLAAVLLCNQELLPLGYQIIALTVDHKLRPTSSREAAFVAKLMNEKGIEHHTLVWKGTKPKSGVEEEARTARYNLIENWCQTNDVKYLITAHHLLDQAETFLMRLSRGSGLDGLCGMKEKVAFKNLTILRPFLKTHPDIFKTYLKTQHMTWIEDESNQDENLLRIKMRRFLPLLEEKTGISALNIVSTMDRLQASRIYFENKIQSVIKNNFKNITNTIFSCPLDFLLNTEDELQYRLFAHLLKTVGKTVYTPEAEKNLKLIKKLKRKDFKSATLNHCKIILHNSLIWILPEQKTKPTNTKQAWKEYTLSHPEYKKIKIPFEVKCALLSLQS